MNMDNDHTRERILAFLDAVYARNTDRVLEFLHDDIDFVGYAPVQIFPYLGHRHGKSEIAETLAAIHHRYSQVRHEVTFIVVEGNKAAVTLKAYLQKRDHDRIVQIQSAHFYTLQDGLIVEMRQFLDSFDIVQQVLERDITDLIAAQLKR
jgi:ketosteroid isomerase-like protein